MTRLRWRIASAFNRLPWTCWADLVSWAIDGRRDQFSDALKPATGCQREGASDACWCAKFCTAEFREKHLVPERATSEDGKP